MAVFGLVSLRVVVPTVCCRLSQRRHAVGCHVPVIALPNCRKSHSQIFILLKLLKISRMFICGAMKCYKEIWTVEDRVRSGRLKSVRAEDAIRTVRERIGRFPLWKQQISSGELDTSTQSSSASSGTIYTLERISAQRDTPLLLL